MPFFLHQVSYTPEALAKLIANPQDRFEAVRGPIEKLGGKIEIDPTRAARDRGADRARKADADVLSVQHAESGLAQWLGDCELIHLLVVALLQVDDLALGGA